MELWKRLDTVSDADYLDVSLPAIGFMPMLKSALADSSKTLHEYNGSGPFRLKDEDKAFDSVSDMVCNLCLKTLKGRLLYKQHTDSEYCYDAIYYWEDGIIETDVSGSYVSVKVLSHNESLVKKTRDFFETHRATTTKIGRVFVITKQYGNLTLTSLGNAGVPLIRENYTPKVIEDYDFILRDLKSKSPSGRISILNGIPGSGKTHIIRDILLSVPDVMHILVSPELISDLSGPEFLPLLLTNRGAHKGPMSLILEDADNCLVARDKKNMATISSLLNLGDGILGSMLDLRIIATTNAQTLQMEEALLRPGRLSKLIEVGHLDYVTARKIFNRLCPTVTLPKEFINDKKFKMSLAEVYSLARKNGWVSEVRQECGAEESDEELDFEEEELEE